MVFLMFVSLVVSLFAIGLTFLARSSDKERKPKKRKIDQRDRRRLIVWLLIGGAVAIVLVFFMITLPPS